MEGHEIRQTGPSKYEAMRKILWIVAGKDL